MATILPFRGYRPRPEICAQVAAVPYDVVTTDEARELVRGNPNSFLRVGRSEVDLPPGADPHSETAYAKARENLDALISSGALARDESPRLYLYRQEVLDAASGQLRGQTGVLSLVSVDEYRAGTIKRHELTRVDKEDDRARHIEATASHSGPAFLAFKPVADISRLMAELSSGSPDVDFTAPDGVRHILWVVRDEGKGAELARLFKDKVPALYIADGHHRSAAAARVRDTLKARNAKHTGSEAYNYFLAVSFPADVLSIMAYNRVVMDLKGLTEARFLAKAAEKFDVRELKPGEAPEPVAMREYGLFIGGSWRRLSAKAGSYPANDPVERLDVQVLQKNLLSPVLGIEDPRTDKRIDFVGGIKGRAELERRCNSGQAAIAFLCRPVTMAELMDVADAGLIMPPKSTWFEPKLRDGMVIDRLD